MTYSIHRKTLSVCAVSILALTVATGDAYAQATEFHIEAQPLSTALLDFYEQSGVTVAAPQGLVANKLAPAVYGEMEADAALGLILSESGLKSAKLPSGAYTITLETVEVTDEQSAPFRLAQVDQGETPGRLIQTESGGSNAGLNDTIIVTGTNIPGIANSASPVLQFDKEAIRASGRTTLQEFIQTLPVNFAGGVSDATVGVVSGGAGAGGNPTDATGINLRGLGNGSTLVLVNGRRIVPSNTGDFVDLSMIPASAIERVEIVTDGASAIYGSDAVGGVLNIILLDEFSGAESRLLARRATQGGAEEYQASQTVGGEWSTGGGFISFDWLSRGNLEASQRSFSENADDGLDILPSQRRFSLFANVHQDLNASTEISGYAMYSKRDSRRNIAFSGIRQDQNFSIDQFSGSLGVKSKIGESWDAEVSAVYGISENMGENLFLGTLVSNPTGRTELLTIEAKGYGDLFATPGGMIRTAIGAQYRGESFDASNELRNTSFKDDRDVFAAYGEVYVPLIGEGNRVPGVEFLELTGAVRWEDYSVFGSTTNPKFGAVWSPIEGLKFRGTWSTSFRAPHYGELDTSGNQVAGLPPFFLPDPSSPSGFSGLVVSSGGNPDLGPEDATIWTVGFDYTAELLSGVTLGATYFNISYDDRIIPVNSEIFLFDAFLIEDQLGDLLTRVSDPTDQAQIFSLIDPGLNFGLAVDDVGGFLDARSQNLAGVDQSGIDANMAIQADTEIGSLTFNLNGTYLLKFDRQITPTAPIVDELDTIFNPTEFRLRTGLIWSNGTVNLAGFLNYTDSYSNNTGGGNEDIDAWTTFDFSAVVDLGRAFSESAFLDGMSVQLSAVNAFNEDPPFVNIPNASFPIGFDGANANPLGRSVSLELLKRF